MAPAPSMSIARDEHGVPRVDAASEAELYRGLGVVHGHDRALAMIVTRFAGQGRMAEHLPGGDDLIELDRTFRRLGLHLGATEQAAQLGPVERRLVDAYCAGANLALARRMPLELRAMGLRAAEPWTPADCVLVSRMAGWVALAQSQGEMEALLVQLVRAGVPRACLDELFPAGLDGLDEDLVRRLVPGEPLVPPAVRWSQALPRPVASNNWVLAPAKTRSGRALLASDPHLELRLPAVWCEVAGTWEGRWIVAATMPGIPAFLVGRTDTLAWGPTYAFMDAVDSWVEECRDGAVRRVVDGADTWVPAAARTEEIRRRRGEPVRLAVHETDRGVLDGPPDAGLRLATRWSGARSGARSLTALADVVRAPDAAAGMAALGRLEAAFNWVLADAGGSIGYQMSGLMPLRASLAGGLAPLPAWDPHTAWQGFAEPEELPRARDPEAGFLVTANDDLNPLGTRAPINLPMGDSRARRIAEELAARDDWTVEAVRELQLDLRARHPEPFLAALRPLLGDAPNERLLRDWDLRYDTGSLGATLFERFHRALLEDVFGGVLGADVVRHLLDETGIVADFFANLDGVLLRESSAWFQGAARAEVYRRAAGRALAQPARPWGEEQQVVLRHLLLGGRLPAWAGYDRGPFPLPGGRGTIRQGQVYRSGGRETSFAPSFRLATDFGEEAAHTALAGGPSDRRTSRWYASGLEAWQAGRLKPLRPR
jgi:penicillin G amidase